MLEAIVNLHDFYSLNLWKILSGGLGWSSHTVKVLSILFFIHSAFQEEEVKRKVLMKEFSGKLETALILYYYLYCVMLRRFRSSTNHDLHSRVSHSCLYVKKICHAYEFDKACELSYTT